MENRPPPGQAWRTRPGRKLCIRKAVPGAFLASWLLFPARCRPCDVRFSMMLTEPARLLRHHRERLFAEAAFSRKNEIAGRWTQCADRTVSYRFATLIQTPRHANQLE